MRLLHRRHRHTYHWRTVHSGVTVSAQIGTCECGDVDEVITGAGEQQIGWWMQSGLTYTEARQKALDGEYPFEFVGDPCPRSIA